MFKILRRGDDDRVIKKDRSFRMWHSPDQGGREGGEEEEGRRQVGGERKGKCFRFFATLDVCLCWRLCTKAKLAIAEWKKRCFTQAILSNDQLILKHVFILSLICTFSTNGHPPAKLTHQFVSLCNTVLKTEKRSSQLGS